MERLIKLPTHVAANQQFLVTEPGIAVNNPIKGTSLYQASSTYNGFWSLIVGLNSTVMFGTKATTINTTTPK